MPMDGCAGMHGAQIGLLKDVTVLVTSRLSPSRLKDAMSTGVGAAAGGCARLVLWVCCDSDTRQMTMITSNTVITTTTAIKMPVSSSSLADAARLLSVSAAVVDPVAAVTGAAAGATDGAVKVTRLAVGRCDCVVS